MTSMFRILGLTALLVLGSVPLFAQTALNQVYLTSAVTSADTTTVALSAADSVAANDVLFLDEEAMTAVTCNATTDICTVRRGQMGTRAEGHLNRAVVWTGTGAQFYYYDPPAGGRCVKANAYPGNREPWINVLTGNISACIQTFGTGTTVAGYWERANLGMAGAGRLAYRAIFYPTSRTSDALVITPALTVNFWDSLVASLTYTGPFEVFLPNPTGLLGKQIMVSDFAAWAIRPVARKGAPSRSGASSRMATTPSPSGAMPTRHSGASATRRPSLSASGPRRASMSGSRRVRCITG